MLFFPPNHELIVKVFRIFILTFCTQACGSLMARPFQYANLNLSNYYLWAYLKYLMDKTLKSLYLYIFKIKTKSDHY